MGKGHGAALSQCYFCLAELTGQHMVDCPGLMPPASHVPAMALPGVEDGEDDETPADSKPADFVPRFGNCTEYTDGLGGFWCTSCQVHAHPACLDCMPQCHVCHGV